MNSCIAGFSNVNVVSHFLGEKERATAETLLIPCCTFMHLCITDQAEKLGSKVLIDNL